MTYMHFNLREGVSRGISKERIISTLNDNEVQFTEDVPKQLLSYANRCTWNIITTGKAYNSQILTTGNLYIDNLTTGVRNINELFVLVHKSIQNDSYFAFKIVTAENIKVRSRTRLSKVGFTIYYPLYFLYKRVLPKVEWFKHIWHFFGISADVSKAEILGRLIFSGFSIVDVFEESLETLIIVKKDIGSSSSTVNPVPSEGIIFRMCRVGKNEEKIIVYKFRSMHPYAEYVQGYMHKVNGLDVGGKFKNDFRVSTGGKIIRRYWIDELPMIFNLIKGDLKLIGVRPISEHYLGLYPDYARKVRVKHKPGLVPPFYADLPKTFEEIVESEMRYLKSYERSPFQTDLKYTVKILMNIIIKSARSG